MNQDKIMTSLEKPLRVINSVAPIRICDNGGWTDTWFAKQGRIFNIAVYPYAEVQIAVYPSNANRPRIIIHAENFGERYVMNPENLGFDRHPLLEAAVKKMQLPSDLSFEVTIFSEAPAGGSTGTSAAVSVALIGALDRLTPGQLTLHEVAHTAHFVETQMLGHQCGIQDQISSAYGGINYIEMHQYPHASVSQLPLANHLWWELERRLMLIYLGKSHSSSKVHETVIAELEREGESCPRLEALREKAVLSKNTLLNGDFFGFGKIMCDNTEAQRSLHPSLVSAEAQQVIDIAKAHGAIGWKVNGAGGDGGSVTLLCGPHSADRRAILRELERSNSLFRNIPIYLSRQGLRVWEGMANKY